MKAVLVNIEKGTVETVQIENELHAYYKALNCSVIDIAERKIDGHPVTVILDDEGLMKDSPMVSAYASNGDPMFVGNLLFVGTEETDDGAVECDIPEEAEKAIYRHVQTVIWRFKRFLKVVVGLDY